MRSSGRLALIGQTATEEYSTLRSTCKPFLGLGSLSRPPPHQGLLSEKPSQYGSGLWLGRASLAVISDPGFRRRSRRGLRARTTTGRASAITQSSWQPAWASALPRRLMMNKCSSWMVVGSCTQMEGWRRASSSPEMSCSRETGFVFQPILSERTWGLGREIRGGDRSGRSDSRAPAGSPKIPRPPRYSPGQFARHCRSGTVLLT